MNIKSGLVELYKIINHDKSKENEFIGWLVKQRYKCKTRGGDSDFGDGVFVFNPDFTECLFYMERTDLDDYNMMIGFISPLMTITEDEFMDKMKDILDGMQSTDSAVLP